ncbi:hypothetical protein [Mycobacterium alsense]|uniref:hypothetical protein n=1 Tax=Mycobacterium alsense TaxID=324058 RepID=UPI0013F4D344|nr:hypothetical protein [Mycobacterium alsense]
MTPMHDRQRLAEGLAALKAAASGHAMLDRLIDRVVNGGDEDLSQLYAFEKLRETPW